ncbi:ABC transporter permease [Oscillospiraceae bacterium HV4-5-C5C]|nr:ABC transporter permease [Oscillospiraceae bacterium HV4-5-C5C]
MVHILNILLDISEQGLIYGIMVLGLMISYKILNFPDLSVDGTFPFGAAVAAVSISHGINPWVALLLALGAGFAAGLITGILNVKLNISNLLSGIIVMTGLYSLNLLIAGQANLPIFNVSTIFNSGPVLLIPDKIGAFRLRVFILSLILILVIKFMLDYFLKTRAGGLLRATGDNQQVVVGAARNPGTVKILGLGIANALVALSGAVLAQQQGFFEVSMGTGQMVAGLASVIIGVVAFTKFKHKPRLTTQVIIGSVVYKALISIAINLGLNANYLKLIQAILFLVILLISFLMDKEARHATASARE